MCPYLSFFFSSRRRHTRFDCDWSSDVCSSDLLFVYCEEPSALVQIRGGVERRECVQVNGVAFLREERKAYRQAIRIVQVEIRSEERRVGKECRSRWSS